MAVVTGASTGIGYELARCCAVAGGLKAMMNGDGDVVTGWHNKLQSALAGITPSSVLAEQHRRQAAPGSAAMS
jgi:NAD(P)-dependent dehydrogenase (short-subunit alcohol dehydrogenase family)